MKVHDVRLHEVMYDEFVDNSMGEKLREPHKTNRTDFLILGP